jgi:hypothetical protein
MFLISIMQMRERERERSSNVNVKKKSKAIPLTGRGGLLGCQMLNIQHFLNLLRYYMLASCCTVLFNNFLG